MFGYLTEGLNNGDSDNRGPTVFVYNSGDKNVLINDWYACLHTLSKHLYVWNAYLNLLGYNIVIAWL